MKSTLLAIFMFGFALNSAFALRILSYNLGLAPTYVPKHEQRLQILLKELPKNNSDVLCLQEVWLKNHREMLVQALKKTHPYAHFAPAKQVFHPDPPICRIKDHFGEKGLVRCLYNNCLSSESLANCFLDKCAEPIKQVTQQRRQCTRGIFAGVGKPPHITILKSLSPLKMFRPGQFAYDGSMGTLILSKRPFLKKGFIDMGKVSSTIRRGSLWAIFESKPKNLFLSCSHFSANFEGSIPYTGHKKSRAHENRLQMGQLIDRSLVLGRGFYQVHAGDFNSSPALPAAGIDASFPNSYQYAIDRGLVSGTIKSLLTTFVANQLNPKQAKSFTLDHFLYPKSDQGLFSAVELRFTSAFELESGEKLPLSDHWAIETVFHSNRPN